MLLLCQCPLLIHHLNIYMFHFLNSTLPVTGNTSIYRFIILASLSVCFCCVNAISWSVILVFICLLLTPPPPLHLCLAIYSPCLPELMFLLCQCPLLTNHTGFYVLPFLNPSNTPPQLVATLFLLLIHHLFLTLHPNGYLPVALPPWAHVSAVPMFFLDPSAWHLDASFHLPVKEKNTN